MSDKEIAKKLKQAGWDPEQIRYAVKKYEGKKTGMADLPFLDSSKKSQPSKKDNLFQKRNDDLYKKYFGKKNPQFKGNIFKLVNPEETYNKRWKIME